MVIRTVAEACSPTGPLDSLGKVFDYEVIVLDDTQREATRPDISFVPRDRF